MNRLREYRLRAHLTQAQLSRKSGVSLPGIAGIENCRCFPRPETREKLSTALHVTVEALFGAPLPPTFKPRSPRSLPEHPSLEPYRKIHCRWCGEPIHGLKWDPEKFRLSVYPRLLTRLPIVHTDGLFYHKFCLEQKIRSMMFFNHPPEK